MPAVLSQARLLLGKLAAATTTKLNNAAPRTSALPLARPFSSSRAISAGRSHLLSPNARGRALQELLDGKDAEREEDEEPGLPAVTSLEWESPLSILKYPDPRLRDANAPIGCSDDTLRRLAEEMFVLMYE